MNTRYSLAYPDLSVGFDALFRRLQSFNDSVTPTNYPPYNLYTTGENQFVFELAVAGFKAEELDVTYQESQLVITGNKESDNTEYLFRGISGRNFTRKFMLADTVIVRDVTLNDGILRVFLENVIPDSAKPVKFAINKPVQSEQQLLVE